MATQIVELSGDEAALLRSYDRAVKKQAELEAKLRAGGAAGDAAGTQIEAALARVERANDTALKGLLGDLKKLGPEGQAAADAMKGHFVNAGKAGYRSMDQVLDQIRAIDPAAAEAAGAAAKSFQQSAAASSSAFSVMSKTAVTEIQSIAGALVGGGSLLTAFHAVYQALEDQKRKYEEVGEAHKKVAASQQETIKNMAGMNAVEQSEMLKKFAPRISDETGVPLTDIYDALAAGKSAGGSDEAVLAAARAAALVNVHTPEQTATYARGAIQLQRQLNLNTAEEAVGFSLAALGPSAVDDAGQLNRMIPQMGRAGATLTDNPDKPAAATEGIAIGVTLGALAGDESGDSSVTANNNFLSQLREEFKNDANAPQSHIGRIKAIRNDPERRKRFLAKMTGEERFKVPMEQLLTPGTAAVEQLDSVFREFSSVDPNSFEDAAANARSATPSLAQSSANRRSENRREMMKVKDEEGLALGSLRKNVAATLNDTAVGGTGLTGMAKNTFGWAQNRLNFAGYGQLGGSTYAEEAVSAVFELYKRRDLITRDGMQHGDEDKVNLIDEEIRDIADTAKTMSNANINKSGAAAAVTRAQGFQTAIPRTEENQAIRQTLDELKELFRSVAASSQQTAQNTGRMPAVTGALSQSAP
jgi:hypothetical protein